MARRVIPISLSILCTLTLGLRLTVPRAEVNVHNNHLQAPQAVERDSRSFTSLESNYSLLSPVAPRHANAIDSEENDHSVRFDPRLNRTTAAWVSTNSNPTPFTIPRLPTPPARGAGGMFRSLLWNASRALEQSFRSSTQGNAESRSSGSSRSSINEMVSQHARNLTRRYRRQSAFRRWPQRSHSFALPPQQPPDKSFVEYSNRKELFPSQEDEQKSFVPPNGLCCVCLDEGVEDASPLVVEKADSKESTTSSKKGPRPRAWARISACGHCMHADCLTNWRVQKDECPLCRTPIQRLSLGEAHEFGPASYISAATSSLLPGVISRNLDT